MQQLGGKIGFIAISVTVKEQMFDSWIILIVFIRALSVFCHCDSTDTFNHLFFGPVLHVTYRSALILLDQSLMQSEVCLPWVCSKKDRRHQ